MDPKIFDDLARTLADSVPKGFREFQQDMEKNVRAALERGFEKLNLVSREEFEIQAAVLARTRSKVDALEKQIAQLEAELRERESSSS